MYGSVCACVCVQVERERERLLPASLARSMLLSFSLPSLAPFLLPALWLLSLSSSTLSFYHLSLSVSLSLSLPPSSPPLSLSPPLSFSSSASLLAVDVTEAEAEATLPLIGCHSQVSDKEKGEEKTGRKAKGGGGERGGWVKGENSALTSQ